MNSRLKALFIALFLLFVLAIIIGTHKSSASKTGTQAYETGAQRVSLIVLESSEGALDQSFSPKAIATSFEDDRTLYALSRSVGDVVIHDTERRSSRKLGSFASMQNVEAFAIGPQGNIYLADSVASQIQVWSPTGQPLSTLPAVRPVSLAMLSNGNLVVASSAAGNLLRLQDQRGRMIGAFGGMRSFDSNNPRQNLFLNRGKVVVGPSDTIYYVSRYAPVPTVRKFSSTGQLLSEFVVEGAAIDYQQEVANRFLREKESNLVGGYDIITSATVDPSTGHLWVSMNGISRAGVVYEYDANGVKLREYSFLLNNSSSSPESITGVKDIVVRSPWIYILTWEGRIHRFNLNNSRTAAQHADSNRMGRQWSGLSHRTLFARMFSTTTIEPLAALQLPCPTVQPFSCVASCRAGSVPLTQDCGAEVKSRLSQGDTITGGNCSNSAGPEPSCSASVNFCNTGTGTRGTISVSLTCNAPPPPQSSEGEAECDPPCTGEYVCVEGLCSNASPIVIDVLGNGFDLTDVASGVRFDLNGDGVRGKLSWTSINSDDAWLALDLNGNGRIDNGAELFGNYTLQPPSSESNGFLALAEYDKPENGGNTDGVIDSSDAIYHSLLLWQDTNHNGISEPNELYSLPALGVARIELTYRESRRRDRHGNEFRYRAKIYGTDSARLGRWAYDVFLISAP